MRVHLFSINFWLMAYVLHCCLYVTLKWCLNDDIQNRSFADQVDLISEIDQKIKEHFHNLLHAVESLSVRVTQLESRMHQVEHSVDYLKESIAYSHGRTDGKLREVENILREVFSYFHYLSFVVTCVHWFVFLVT